MKKTLALCLCLCLLFATVPGIVYATEETADNASLTKEEAAILGARASYTDSLASARRGSFHGYCGLMTSHQLYNLKINKSCVSNDGNDQFDYYENMSRTSGGYYIRPYNSSQYSLLQALETITGDGTRDAYNILVGFQWTNTESGAYFGHAVFINAILDGTVYFVESFHCPLGGPEGTVITCSMEEFAKYFDKWTIFDGAIHFGSGRYSDICPYESTDLFVQTRFDSVIRSEPCLVGQNGCIRVRSVAAGERLHATGIFSDGYTVYYRVQTNDGEGFISAGAVSPIRINSESLTLTDLQLPRSWETGKPLNLSGTVTARYGSIASVEILVTDPEGNPILRELADTAGTKADLSVLNEKLIFDLLDAGVYTVSIYASGACSVVNGTGTYVQYKRTLLDSRTLFLGVDAGNARDIPAPVVKTIFKDGWVYENDKWYLYDNNTPCTGWTELMGVRYYLDNTGAALTGQQEIQGQKLYFSASGAMVTGWLTLDGKTYYLDDQGVPVTGWQNMITGLYCFDKDGCLITEGDLIRDGITYQVAADGRATVKEASVENRSK